VLKTCVHQIGANFALKDLAAPISDIFEDEQAQDPRRPAATAVFGMSFGERLLNRRHNFFIFQNLIGVAFFAKVAHLFGDQTLTEAELEARPILMRLSASTPSPTQRLMPTSPRYRQRLI
jgi:hypothetical protein